MDDGKIIELFFERSEEAIEELGKKYGKICYQISYNILNNRLDAEECVSNTYLSTWNSIPPQRPNNLMAYVCKIVRNHSITRHRENTAMKRNSTYDVAMSEIENCLSAPDSPHDILEAKVMARAIEDFLDTLSLENRVIFVRRYWYADNYEQIAVQTGLSKKRVAVRLTRIRKQLRSYLKKREVLA